MGCNGGRELMFLKWKVARAAPLNPAVLPQTLFPNARSKIVTFKIQTFYPDAGMFMNTNHEAETLGPLRELMNSELFDGFTAQIVDGNDRVVYGPQTRERNSDLGVKDIADMLNVPMLNSPEELFDQIPFDDDDEDDDDF